jgi:DnaJ-class molecular chaperone
MEEVAGRRTENIKASHEPCYFCDGTGHTVTGQFCSKCTGRGFFADVR